MKCLLLVALVAAAAAAPQHRRGGDYNDDHHEKTPYSYEYAVHDPHYGAQFTKKETSDGGNVQGQYSVLLPDGRTQHVKYYADHYGGYNADVTYEGYAKYPEYHAPAYKPAPAYHEPAYKPEPAYHEPAYQPAYHGPVHGPAYHGGPIHG